MTEGLLKPVKHQWGLNGRVGELSRLREGAEAVRSEEGSGVRGGGVIPVSPQLSRLLVLVVTSDEKGGWGSEQWKWWGTVTV